ncbi:MAG: efflux RND transporter permease subunit [Spirochaetaceae bacterium]|nr:efflux RND transporter permease subunit [Spirochaetaceae bacterium]
MNKNWFNCPVQAFFVLCCLSIVMAFIAKDINLGKESSVEQIVYSIQIEYFGMDPKTLERLITIPLEEYLSPISGLKELRSVTEYGRSLVTAYFHNGTEAKKSYLTIRDAVDTLYATLPQAVQKPKIYSSHSQQGAVLSVAITEHKNLNTLRSYLDLELKTLLEGVDGVAEVIVSGGSIQDIVVEFDSDKVSAGGINPRALGTVIQEANAVNSGGVIRGEKNTIPVVLDTRIASLEQIRQLPVATGEGVANLSAFATVNYSNRSQEEIVRVNGDECVGIVIKSTFDGNPLLISKACRKIIEESPVGSSNYKILYDKGEDFSKVINSTIKSVIESFFVVMLLVPLFFYKARVTILLGFLLPITVLWTLAELHLLGYIIDKNTLSGVGIALGFIVDTPFLVAELAEKSNSFFEFINKVKKVLPSIISSCATTILCLIPLFFLQQQVPGIADVAFAVALMLLNSTLIATVFLPCFVFGGNTNEFAKKISVNLEKKYTRLTEKCCIFFLKRKKISYCCFVSLCFVPIVLFVLAGKNIEMEEHQDILQISVEYESDTCAEVIDSDIQELLEQIQLQSGFLFVRSEVKTGNATLEVGFDPKVTERKELANSIQRLSSSVPKGFLYVPDAGEDSRGNLYQIEISITGDEEAKCKQIAREALQLATKSVNVVQGVLNFKEGESQLTITPQRVILAKSGLFVEDVANHLRWLLFGPVVDKWIKDGTEKDIRVTGQNKKKLTAWELEQTSIPTEKSAIRLGSVAKIQLESGVGKLFRRDTRSAAYFTLHINASSTQKAMECAKEILAQIPLEKGYGFRFIKEIEELREYYRNLFFLLLGCIFGILILLLGLTENFSKAIKLTAVIPASIALPMIIKLIQSGVLETGDLLGMVVVGGLAVNNAIYIAESEKSITILKIKDKLKSVLVTSLSTMAGAIPLVITGRGFTEQLAFFMLWGTAGSLIVSLLLFPSIIDSSNNK